MEGNLKLGDLATMNAKELRIIAKRDQSLKLISEHIDKLQRLMHDMKTHPDERFGFTPSAQTGWLISHCIAIAVSLVLVPEVQPES